ncbi:hypothetical protein ABIA48_000400 [Pseudomonas sp. S30_BP2TU TE3576]|uniref:hypothetical protein n=1 Tax=Pseudomonas sp. S30_BP2TU TE3576 TaxID=3349329 RepID=UPI003D1B7FAA
MTIEIKAELAETGPVYICHGATGDQHHILKVMPADDSPWANQQVSRYDDGEQMLPIDVVPAADEYQTFLPEGAEFKIHCPASGTDADLKLWLRSEFTAVPYGIDLHLGDYRRVIAGSKPPAGFPQLGEPVVAEITVGSFYISGKLLAAVDVKWLLDGELVQTVPTEGTGKSTVSISGIGLGEHTITASVYSEYDDSKTTHDFKINVISESPWKDATVEINGKRVPVDQPIWLPRGKSDNKVKLTAPLFAGKAVQVNAVDSDGLNIEANPAFGQDVPLDDITGVAEWTLTQDEAKSGQLKLVFLTTVVTPTLELDCRVMSDNLADEADVKIDGVAVPAGGNWFIRDKLQTVTLTPKSGSPLAGLPVTLACTIKSGLDVADVVSAPDFDSEQTSYSWAVTGKTKSGTFQLSLAGKGMTTPINLAISKLVSSNLADEVEVKIGGQSVPSGGSVFFRGQAKDVELIPKSGSPIAGYPIALARTATSPLLPTDLSSEPAFEVPQTTHNWRVTGANNKSGIFQLQLTAQGMTTVNVTANKLLSSNLADEVEVKIGGVAVPAGGNWFIRDKSQTVTLTPKSGSPLAGLPVTLACTIKDGLDVDNVVSAPGFGSEQTTYSWSVSGKTKSGTFQLSLAGKGMTTPINLAISKLVSSNLADEATPLLNGKVISDTGATFAGGEEQTLTLGYKGGGFLAGAPLRLNWVPKSGLELNDVYSEPHRNQETTNHSWGIVCAREKSGVFDLKLSLGDEQGVLAIPDIRLFPFPVNFRFIRDSSTDHPLPPTLVTAIKDFPFVCVVRLVTWEGSPLVGKAVTFIVPERPDVTVTTDASGIAGTSVISYNTVGVREVSAEVLLEGVKHSVKVLVDVKE